MLAHLKPRAKTKQLEEILTHACRHDRQERGRHRAAVLHEVAELMPRRGLVVVVSDLFFPAEDVFSGLDHLLFRGHDLIVFHVLDPLEHGLSVGGQVRFQDLETGEELTTQTDEIRPLYEKAHRRLAARAGRRASRPLGRPRALDDRPAARAGLVRLSDATVPTFLIASFILAGLGFIHLGFLAAGGCRGRADPDPSAVPPAGPESQDRHALLPALGPARFRPAPKVRRWVLLALRAAGVLLLALLFARPYRTDASAQAAEREVILLIDRSASMGDLRARSSPFAKAQQQAASC